MKYNKEHISLLKAFLEDNIGKQLLHVEYIEELKEFISILTKGEFEFPGATLSTDTIDTNQLSLFPAIASDPYLEELTILAYKAFAAFSIIGVEMVDVKRLKRRFDFLGIKLPAAKVFLVFCMKLERDHTEQLIIRGKDCVDKHHSRLGDRIGKFNDVTLIEVFLCSDEQYMLKYFTYIENNRALYDKKYIKKTHM